MEEFAHWLEYELKKRGWSPSELARRSRLGNSTITRILNRTRNAGPDVCTAIAQALGEPPEKIFRLAGILPPAASEDDPTYTELTDLAHVLTPQERREVIYYINFLLFRRKKGE